MKILVTGGLGFIGSNFILHVLKNYPKIEIINLDAGLTGSNINNLKEIEKSKNYYNTSLFKSNLYLLCHTNSMKKPGTTQ